jgi:tRNA-specific 2-thiouridylase
MKIAVLMSGGIDSSLVALYLKEKGYNIIGLTFLQLGEDWRKEEFLRAKRVTELISMPHFIFNIQNIFRKEIIKPFYHSFYKGETPNPCPFCNQKIKFGILFDKAKKLGVKKIATGHYARVEFDKRTKKWLLKPAKDKRKDQSYFLWRLTQNQLSKIILPLGNFKEEEVWQKIKKSPLKKIFQKEGFCPAAERGQKVLPKVYSYSSSEARKTRFLSEAKGSYRGSQDICFLKGKKISDVLNEKFKNNPGPIYNLTGREIGQHPGIQFFTIGQRSGLRIKAKTPRQKPLYVVKIVASKNTIIVGEEKDLYKKDLLARDVSWILGKEPKLPLKIGAKIRYRHKASLATIYHLKSNIHHLKFDRPQRAITPGQHIVFYKKNLLLGGGIIAKD